MQTSFSLRRYWSSIICWIAFQRFTQIQPLLMKMESFGSCRTIVMDRFHISAISALQIYARYLYIFVKLKPLSRIGFFTSESSTFVPQGLVMDHIRGSSPSDQIPTRFIYLGDGGGDFCPTLKLRESDCVMPRTNYPLWKRISDNSSLIKAQVKEWSNAEELERILMQLVTAITKEDS